MKERYLDLMEKSLSAYTDEHIDGYFDSVKENGLTEHGFARLTSNMGILISHGRREDLISRFVPMMDFCCETIPHVKAANDFSVREIICCLWEVERSNILPKSITDRWRALLSEIDPTKCYDKFAKTPTDKVRNWALFTALSEYFRQSANLCDSSEFIDIQLASQLQWIDENGMYMDNSKSDVHQPIMYDLVPRGLFSLLLHFGYHGKYFEEIDSLLKKSALHTLKMQSSIGEMAFGGRSNQFLHNEGWLCAIFEYEANRYAREGNYALAAEFKCGVEKAMSLTEHWLSKSPIRHIKNRFPTESGYGCENYAYFDKYMITTASNLYAAHLVCDDSIASDGYESEICDTFVTSEHFHKIFLRCGDYSAELDTNADPHYDASGLGRVHRLGAPSAICLSVPCPLFPKYKLDVTDNIALSLCPGILVDGEPHFATDTDTKYRVISTTAENGIAETTVECTFSNGNCVAVRYALSDSGLSINASGDGEILFMLPAFSFDGELHTEITLDEQSLSISYEGYVCCYITDGEIHDTERLGANRNGHYRAFYAKSFGKMMIGVKIVKKESIY